MKASLEEYIFEHASQTPEKIAVVCRGKETTYSELWSMILTKADSRISLIFSFIHLLFDRQR